MDAKLFLAYLPWLREPDYSIELNGLDAGYAQTLMEYTTPIPRLTPLRLANAPKQIQALYVDTDLSKIHMLWTRFLIEPKLLPQGWHFAQMDETLIVMANGSGRVEAYEEHPIRAIYGESHFLGVLAKDVDSYLEALLCGALNVMHFSPGFADQPGVKEKLEPIAKLCSAIAGGDEYYDFWAGLLGL